MTRLRTILVFVALFGISVAVRHPLFNHEFTASWEWLAAHTLMTAQLWDATPANIHHFNLLYTFPNPGSKFIDDLWNSGVVDARGNYYYVSMPHLAFLTPYAFLKLLGWGLTQRSLQLFTLAVHFVACGLLYVLARRLTPESRLPSVAAVTVLLFAPTALFYYQNAVVGTVLVIPYTIAALWSTDVVLSGDQVRRRLAWTMLGASLFLGCLTDWQSYFTAFAIAAVAAFLALRTPPLRRRAVLVAVVCCAAVALAAALTVLQHARINGMDAFGRTILGRLRVRSGFSGQGFGLTDPAYYRNMARFYGSYLQFILLGAATALIAWRRGRASANRSFARGRVVLAVSILAVLADHVVLAHHTAEQSFTTLNGLVPIALLAAIGVSAFLKISSSKQGPGLVTAALIAGIGLSIAEYYIAYGNRPHPFRAAAAQITAFARPDDVIFAMGGDYRMQHDDIIPQMLYYMRRNVLVVTNEDDARQFLIRRGFTRGVLARINTDWTIAGMQVVTR